MSRSLLRAGAPRLNDRARGCGDRRFPPLGRVATLEAGRHALQHGDEPRRGLQHSKALSQFGLAEGLIEKLERALVAGMRLQVGLEPVQPRQQGVAALLDIVVTLAKIFALCGDGRAAC